MALVPENIQQNAPAGFPSPSVSSRKIRDYQDDSSNADSYGSLLTAGTDTSQMTSDDTVLDELPTTFQYPSYAAAVGTTESNSSVGSTTQVSSQTTSTFVDWQKENQELVSPPHLLEWRTKCPQRIHIEKDMRKSTMHEDV